MLKSFKRWALGLVVGTLDDLIYALDYAEQRLRDLAEEAATEAARMRVEAQQMEAKAQRATFIADKIKRMLGVA